MHVLIATDQHAESLGGVQVAIRLQIAELARLGHTVSVVAPALHRSYEVSPAVAEACRVAADVGARAATAAHCASPYIDVPSLPITRDREYGMFWPGRRTDHFVLRALQGRPRVDLVHVQGDFWGALTGLRLARRLGVPVVHTLHNHVDAGTRAVTPLAPVLAPVAFAGMRLWRQLALGKVRQVPLAAGTATSTDQSTAGESSELLWLTRHLGAKRQEPRGAWHYLQQLAAEAAVVSAPSPHFARELLAHSVADRVAVTPGGVSERAIAAALSEQRSPRSRPQLVWLGRMSHEKRVLELVRAFAESGADADLTLHGAGLLLPRVRELVAELGLGERVQLAGPVPYPEALRAMHDADALLQTSIGFETQGLTPFEAAALGTPTVFADPRICEDLGVTPAWVAGEPTVAALAGAIARAADEISAAWAAGGSLRVADSARESLLQPHRTREMLAAYEAALACTAR